MLVRQVMCTDVRIVHPSTSFREAAQMMRDRDCGFLPVGSNDRLQGAVTDRDIVIRGLAEGKKPDAPVSDVMSDRIIYCFDEDDVEDAARRMKRDQIRRLAVLNADRRLVGVVSLGDIARGCEDERLTGDIENAVAEDTKVAAE
ncbi:CBS domain-containing protein [Asticcacaulis sp. YBE204]|uniref:CBS domain-containing protein n=1 Tax=Asticcacaulis sp. YBE204 TaxID=1282363 RepID=UPI0003C3EF7B|nr:CBS domain-containing protein [Asticcacaulis sp. YBE204]ESQ77859.1 hypothetical protein AEYBE204_17165 [Asticcacaulis sp. YBE204]